EGKIGFPVSRKRRRYQGPSAISAAAEYRSPERARRPRARRTHAAPSAATRKRPRYLADAAVPAKKPARARKRSERLACQRWNEKRAAVTKRMRPGSTYGVVPKYATIGFPRNAAAASQPAAGEPSTRPQATRRNAVNSVAITERHCAARSRPAGKTIA